MDRHTVLALFNQSPPASGPFYWHGKRVNGVEWNLLGELKLKCKAGGATLKFGHRAFNADSNWKPAGAATVSSWFTCVKRRHKHLEIPAIPQPTDDVIWIVGAYTTKSGMADSDVAILQVRHWRCGVGDPLP